MPQKIRVKTKLGGIPKAIAPHLNRHQRRKLPKVKDPFDNYITRLPGVSASRSVYAHSTMGAALYALAIASILIAAGVAMYFAGGAA